MNLFRSVKRLISATDTETEPESSVKPKHQVLLKKICRSEHTSNSVSHDAHVYDAEDNCQLLQPAPTPPG